MEERAKKACLGIQTLEESVPTLLQAPLTTKQREALIMAWLVPCALALSAAKLAHRLKIVVHVAMHVCHGAIAICHTMGTFVTWNGFAVIGVALAAAASTLAGAQLLVADAKEAQAVGDELLHVGVRFVSKLSKEVSEAEFSAVIEELLAAKKGGAAAATRGAAAKGTPSSNAAETKVQLDA